jgi:RsiW-degrading membrane proteinase PrsW (M82 family)
MVILTECSCGRTIRASDKLAGRWVKCPQCGQPVQIPGSEPQPQAPPPTLVDVPLAADEPSHSPAAVSLPPSPFNIPHTGAPQLPRPVISAPDEDITAAEASWRGKIFWLLLLAMLPLAVQTLAGHEDTIDRIKRTLKNHPDLEQRFGELGDHMTRRDADRLIQLLPEHRLDGALVPRGSLVHWPWALAAAGIFFGIVVFAIPGFPAKPLNLVLAGLFTGTGGVLLLLGIQIVGFFCFCCIGAAYLAALDPRAPFGPSLLGFFFGVGFFEEFIKCLPVLFLLYRYEHVPWRTACVWGMASGAGFGISEGIHYASNYYNGFEPLGIYFVRFLSCVAFHTLLSGACAILLQRKMHFLQQGEGPYDWIFTLMAIISVPIFLHGLFDTLAKKNMDILAFGVAIAAFAWLAWLIKTSRERERIGDKPAVAAPRLVHTERGTRFVGP